MALVLSSNDGTYSFEQVESVTMTRRKSDVTETEIWSVDAVMTGAGFAALNTKLDALEHASTGGLLDGKDWELEDDGIPTSLRKLTASAHWPGWPKVRVFALPQRPRDAAWVDQLRFRVQVEGRISLRSSDTIFWTETIVLTEAFTEAVIRKAIGGVITPVVQTTALAAALVQQSGEATGLTAYPSFPSRVIGGGTEIRAPIKTKVSPKRAADGSLREYKIIWSYEDAHTTTPTFTAPGTPPA